MTLPNHTIDRLNITVDQLETIIDHLNIIYLEMNSPHKDSVKELSKIIVSLHVTKQSLITLANSNRYKQNTGVIKL